jgi:hypothetical protein
MIITTKCFGSARHHLGKYKHWVKKISKVDFDKTNGYAFIGDFLTYDKEISADENDYIIENSCGTYYFYKAKDGRENGVEGTYREFSSFLEKIKNYYKPSEKINKLEKYTDQELLEEVIRRKLHENNELFQKIETKVLNNNDDRFQALELD